jgi:hypothetical protein
MEHTEHHDFVGVSELHLAHNNVRQTRNGASRQSIEAASAPATRGVSGERARYFTKTIMAKKTKTFAVRTTWNVRSSRSAWAAGIHPDKMRFIRVPSLGSLRSRVGSQAMAAVGRREVSSNSGYAPTIQLVNFCSVVRCSTQVVWRPRQLPRATSRLQLRVTRAAALSRTHRHRVVPGAYRAGISLGPRSPGRPCP